MDSMIPSGQRNTLAEYMILFSADNHPPMYFSFGRHLDELHVTWAHLEKKRTRLQTNTKTLEDLCSQSLETASQAIHDAVTTHQVTVSQHSMTASARTDSNADLEDSSYDGITTKMRRRRVIFPIYTNPNLGF
ncbi:hypothetical protein Tco_0676293 [Tanacetum coccineum]